MASEPDQTVTQAANSPSEVYLGIWFPLGSNNIIRLGRNLYRYSQDLRSGDKQRPAYLVSESSPMRVGNTVQWTCWLRVHLNGTDYAVESVITWHGSGYLKCRGRIKSRQEGPVVNDPPAQLIKASYDQLRAHVTNTMLCCFLDHQTNYAKNVLFGLGLSAALNNFDPHSEHVDAAIRAKIVSMRHGNSGVQPDEAQLRVGLEYLAYRLIMFPTLDDRTLSLYDDDFQHDSFLRQPLSSDAAYRKGQYVRAYDLSLNTTPVDADRYIERRGTIALGTHHFKKPPEELESLVDYLLNLNSGLHFVSLVSYELGEIRRDIIKARQFLVQRDEFDNIMADFVVFLESKLPLMYELIEYVDCDLRMFIAELREKCKDDLQFLETTDRYFGTYTGVFDTSIRTLQRLVQGLREELATLSDYISTQVQQQSIQISREMQTASVRSLDTQSTLAEFQRSSILKGSRTRWIGTLAISTAISGTGIWKNVAVSLWNTLLQLGDRLLGIQIPVQTMPVPPPDWFTMLIQVLGFLVSGLVIGRIILFVERGIPEIVQVAFDFDRSVNLDAIQNQLKGKDIRLARDTGGEIKLTWSDKVRIALDPTDIKAPGNPLLRFWRRIRIRLRTRNAETISANRPSICTLEYSTQVNRAVADRKSERVLLRSFSITIDRESSENMDAYLYPAHLYAAQFLKAVVDDDVPERKMSYILDAVRADQVERLRRSRNTIRDELGETQTQSG